MRLEDRRLRHIGPLRGLQKVARDLDLPLTVFGGVASRAAMYLTYRPRRPLDLFDLAPFSSDIDLEYDADADRGPELLASIQTHVPFASWFRWSLVDRDRAAKAAAQRAISTVVPLRSIRFATHEPATISDAALRDLKTGNVTFERNPNFKPDGVDGQGRDVELFGLMMALNAEADLRALCPSAPGIDRAAAHDWLQRDGWRDLQTIARDDRLCGRFWTLFATQRVLGRARNEIFQELVLMADRLGVFSRLGYDPTAEEGALGLSKLGRAGQFRAHSLRPQVMSGGEGRELFMSVLRDVRGGLGLSLDLSEPEDLIDPALELVAVAPRIQLQKLPDDLDRSGSTDVFESGIDDEFIEIAWPHRGAVTNPRGLTAQLFPYSQRTSGGAFSSVPATGGVRGEQAWIRIRLDDLLDREDERSEAVAALVILQARHG